MSFKSREKKRRRKAAIARTKREYSSTTDTRYYLTLVKHPCRCSACGGKLGPGVDMVYRRNGQVTLCLPCADKDPLVEYRPSIRWEQSKQSKRWRERQTSLWDKAA